ncbi:hypothetical protein C4D60_Mb07t18490 [Musa balbisiana]|uniref:Phosphofructokinase domain-containing protein n=1 Tax=Musa balbisiana TaxID=52838 RepID=A0A4S8JG82_MUSBA|nr:hypothetical protein C4D60_Mb07t18490 [Musa balbisiana]
MGSEGKTTPKIVRGEGGYVLEDVPHPIDYLPDLPVSSLSRGFLDPFFFLLGFGVGANLIVVHKSSPEGCISDVYFVSDEVHACIVTCGGLCPGLNTVIREIVCGLYGMYGVRKVLGIEGGYKGFYSSNTTNLTPKSVNDIHKRGGTILCTSRGGHDTLKIVDSIEDRGINQVYIIGGDGTQKGASVIFDEIRRRGLKVAVAGIPKTIDNDIAVIDQSFGFDTAVEEAQRAINAAHVEAESIENGIGVVKLMGRYSESPFRLEGKGELLEFIEKRLKENGHMVIVVAEGTGQDLTAKSMRYVDHQVASRNKLLLDVCLWLSQKIKVNPTYMIGAIPSYASDNIYCTLLAHSAIHGAMAGGYTGVGPVNGRYAYIPFHYAAGLMWLDRMWTLLLSSTNQPSFLGSKDVEDAEGGATDSVVGRGEREAPK